MKLSLQSVPVISARVGLKAKKIKNKNRTKIINIFTYTLKYNTGLGDTRCARGARRTAPPGWAPGSAWGEEVVGGWEERSHPALPRGGRGDSPASAEIHRSVSNRGREIRRRRGVRARPAPERGGIRWWFYSKSVSSLGL